MKQKKMTQKQVENLLCRILPRDYVKEDLTLVHRAKDEESEYKLYEHYRSCGLCSAAEAELMKKAPSWMLEDYVERKSKLCAKAQIALFERKEAKTIMTYIKKDPYPAYRAKMVLVKWDTKEAREIMTEMLQDEFKQQFFVNHAALDFLYDSWKILYPEYRKMFIRRAARVSSPFIDKIVIFKGNSIEEGEEALLVRYCSDEALKHYISKHSLHAEAQVMLVKKRGTIMTQLYLYEHPFTSKEAINILARMPWQAGFNRQMLHKDVFDVPEKVQIKILKEGSNSMKEALLKRGKLNIRAEKALIRSGDFEFAKKYIAKYGLSYEAQEFLISNGNKELVLHFIHNYDLIPTAKIILLIRGSHEKVMALLKCKHRLDDIHAEALFQRRNREEIEQYLQNQHPELLPL